MGKAEVTFHHVLTYSGLTKAELATLYSVSRQTIYHWAKGSKPWDGTPSSKLAETITTVLCNAIELRILPLRQVGQELRKERIAKMRDTLHSLKSAPIK